MRDSKRIPKIIQLLQELWMKNPDLRFGQLINMIEMEMIIDGDSFYIEDEVWLEKIKQLHG